MIRRILLLTLLGSSLQVVASAIPASAQTPTPYRNVGRNPRGVPVLSWQDALSYMQSHPKFQKDLMVLLPQGLSPEVRDRHWPRVVSEVRDSVEVARAHQFMGGRCPVCSGRRLSRCERATELSHRFQRLPIPRGTQYLAVTEGEDGRVTFNRVFLGDAMAYRVSVLDGRGFIDLIARCRNAALGRPSEWEAYTGFTPSAPPAATLAPPPLAPPPLAPIPESGTAGFIESRGAPAAGYPTLPPVAYIGPGQPQFYPRGYHAGSLALWFRPDVRVRVTQTAPTAVGGVSGETTTPTSTITLPTVVVGPTTFELPPVTAGTGSPAQAPVQAPIGGSSNVPTQAPVQGPSSQQQGPQQR